jgi:hypothetical protein
VSWYVFTGSFNYVSTGSGVVTNNSWQHIAVVWTNSNVKIYVNGTQQASGTRYSPQLNNELFKIGASDLAQSTSFWSGYISNFRVATTAVYTGAFTPPASPLQSTQAGNGGTIQAITGTQTSLLTCQSNRFIDNSAVPFTITPSGTPRVQAFQPFSPTASYTTALYGGSGYFTGSGYLTAPDNAAFSFGNGDFTVECWIYLTALGTQGIWSNGNSATGTFGFYINAANKLEVGYYGGATVTGATSLTTGTWFHVAVSRSGGTVTRVFLNGVQDATNTSSFNNTSNKCAVGVPFADNTSYLSNGYMSNLRVVKGTAVYTGAFTPPTLAPLTTAGSTSAASYSSTLNVNTSFAASNTSLLLNMANAGIYDAAAQNDFITAGAAVTNTTTKQWPPSSVSFNGSTSYLTAPSNVALAFGSADFTIEFWMYANAIPTNPLIAQLYDTRPASTNGAYILIYLDNDGTIKLWVNSANRITSSVISTGAWIYVALTRSSGVTKMFLNGTQTGSNYTDSTVYLASAPFIGASFSGGAAIANFFNGYIQDFRITRGVARTIAPPPPTAPFPTR